MKRLAGPHDPRKGEAPPEAATLADRDRWESSVLAAALEHRRAQKALADHVSSGRTTWKDVRSSRMEDDARIWRARRQELTDEVSRTRIALLDVVRG